MVIRVDPDPSSSVQTVGQNAGRTMRLSGLCLFPLGRALCGSLSRDSCLRDKLFFPDHLKPSILSSSCSFVIFVQIGAAAVIDLSSVAWRKSAYSSTDACVEVAFVDCHVAVRDSKDRHGPVLLIHQC